MLATTKLALGGSSLKKLTTILDQTDSNGILRHQYLHAGAGRTHRTSCRGVQMQNLKRLGKNVEPLTAERVRSMNNTEMADNLRQVFTSHDPGGLAVVLDLSQIEARVLPYLAGQTDKLDLFRQGLDLYMVLAAKMYSVTYDQVTKDQRSQGKVGELGCGYGIGADALLSYAEKMGILLTLEECQKIVVAWRASNDKIVKFWWNLNSAMKQALASPHLTKMDLGVDGLAIEFSSFPEVESLQNSVAGSRHLIMTVSQRGSILFSRSWRGVWMEGNEVYYHEAPDSGPLWLKDYEVEVVDPSTGKKTIRIEHPKLYGGKITGVLVQSFARELFFDAAVRLKKNRPSIPLMGQFHDEIVADWNPVGLLTMYELEAVMLHEFTTHDRFPGLPVDATVQHAYRYIK